MHKIRLMNTAVTHQLYRRLLVATGRDEPSERDRGAVSLEQVLWFVAAGVSVAVIAGILWQQIRTEAEKPIDPPDAP